MSYGDQVACPLPKRSSVHDRLAEESTLSAHSRGRRSNRTSSSRGRVALRWSGATATTGMLAAILAVPASAAAMPATTAPDSDRVAGKFGVEQSWAEVKSSVEDTSTDLRRDPAAASRARIRVPVEVKPCAAEVDIAANGSRQMTTQQMVYMPLREGTFSGTSYYGYRIHPVYGYLKLHEGDDYAAASGTPIYAAADGVVKTVSYDSSRGNYVEIEHHMEDGSVYDSLYLHQSGGGITVSVGQTVSAGQHIGAVGSTGTSTGAHLHFEIRDSSGSSLPPSQWLETYGAVFLGEGC